MPATDRRFVNDVSALAGKQLEPAQTDRPNAAARRIKNVFRPETQQIPARSRHQATAHRASSVTDLLEDDEARAPR